MGVSAGVELALGLQAGHPKAAMMRMIPRSRKRVFSMETPYAFVRELSFEKVRCLWKQTSMGIVKNFLFPSLSKQKHFSQ
jgi:hypothetical protein